MGSNNHVYILTEVLLRRLKAICNTESVKCQRCGRLFEVGNCIVGRGRTRTKIGVANPKYYHVECWESLFVEVPD